MRFISTTAVVTVEEGNGEMCDSNLGGFAPGAGDETHRAAKRCRRDNGDHVELYDGVRMYAGLSLYDQMEANFCRRKEI